MLISLNWIRDFVDLPEDLDPRELANRFTLTCAEVESAEPVAVEAHGLIAVKVLQVEPVGENLYKVALDVGDRTVQTASVAPDLQTDCTVVYAPPGAGVADKPAVGRARVRDIDSEGMILPCEWLGMTHAVQEAVFLPPDISAGTPIAPEVFGDFLIEVDNKSITHRPDLWGHYGIARELAAMYRLPLKPYPERK